MPGRGGSGAACTRTSERADGKAARARLFGADRSARMPRVNAPAGADQVRLTLRELRVEGSHVIAADELADLWRSDVGQEITVARLYGIADAITARYAEAGYLLSFAIVPKQKIAGGDATLRVVEGYVDHIGYTGDALANLVDGTDDDHPDGAIFTAIAARILASRPLRNADLERALFLINSVPGVLATASFAPSVTTPGASTLTITVARKTIGGEFSADNHMSAGMGRWSVGGAATVNGAINGVDALHVSAHCSVSGCDTYRDGSASWQTLIGPDGLKVSATGSFSDDQPQGGLLSSLRFHGKSRQAGVDAAYPAIKSRETGLDFGGGFELKDAQTTTFAGVFSEDALRIIDGYADWQFSDRTSSISDLRLTVDQGIPALGATSDGNPVSRAARAVRRSSPTSRPLCYGRNRFAPSLPNLSGSPCIWRAAGRRR